MNAIITLTMLLTINGLFQLMNAQEWGYEESNGPDTWAENFPICDDQQQSPIAIVSDEATVNYTLAPFPRRIFENHPEAMVIQNTGHTLQVDLTGGYTINDNTLLPGVFKAAQFHLHWAKPGERGSEHTFNGVQYFGELHIVHYNEKYENLGAAANQPDGLAVLGFFIQDDYPQDNLAFNRLLDLVTNGTVNYYREDFAYDQLFSMETLIPPSFDVYYRYDGSLTTPPCYESVVWTVFDSVLPISRSQAMVLESSLYETERNEAQIRLYGNFRPPQFLNSRRVTRSPPCDRGSASAIQPFFLITAALAMLLSVKFLC